MTFFIHTPAGTDRYSLTSDLRILADDISSHLDNLQNTINLTVKENSSPTFTSVMTNSAPIFPGITLTGTMSTSSIINNADGFGLKSGSLKLTTTNGTSWVSNGPIRVPDSATGSNVINANTLNAALASRDAAIAALQTAVNGLQSGGASKAYVDQQDAALSARITTAQTTANLVSTKANHNGNVNQVSYATSAGSATSATNSTNATNATHLSNKAWAMGMFDAGSLGAGNTGSTWVTHGLGKTPTAILANARYDTGVVSIVCSVDTADATKALIKYRNINESTAESCWINWVAIA